MEIIISAKPWQRAAALSVRMQVFVQERHIDLKDEFDDNDLPTTLYAVAYAAPDKPVATGRFQAYDNVTMQPERIATLADYRGQHLGAQIINALENVGRQHGYQKALIHSELTAQGFYESLGYHRTSDVFMEDGVPCVLVQKDQL